MKLPKTMKAVVLMGHGDMDQLHIREDWPTPQAGPDEVVIKVGACGMNNTDVNTRSGWYSKAVTDATTGDGYSNIDAEDPSWGGAPLSFPRIQGADAVGIVVAVGENAPDELMGKRVMVDTWLRDWDDPMNKNATGYFGSECDGGFCEYTRVHHRNAVPVNSSLSDAELATFSCSYSTAEGMVSRAQVGQTDVVLVTGASGGVGSALVQLAKRRGATVVAMASASKHPQVSALGADVVLPRDVPDLSGALSATVGKSTVSVVCDIVGGDVFAQVLDVLERGGRYACSGAIAGPIVHMDLRTMYLRDLTLHGSTVVPPHTFRDVVSYIENGEIRPVLAQSFALDDFHAGQSAFIEKNHTGNMVVVP